MDKRGDTQRGKDPNKGTQEKEKPEGEQLTKKEQQETKSKKRMERKKDREKESGKKKRENTTGIAVHQQTIFSIPLIKPTLWNPKSSDKQPFRSILQNAQF